MSLRRIKGEKIVVYPEYLDANLSRSQGRRVSKNILVPRPSLDELFQAAEKLGLNPEIEADKSYPRRWYNKRGRLIVDKQGSKRETLIKLAREIRFIREMKRRG